MQQYQSRQENNTQNTQKATPISENWHEKTVYDKANKTLPEGEDYKGPARVYIRIYDQELAELIASEPNYLRKLKYAIEGNSTLHNIKGAGMGNVVEAVDIIYSPGTMAYEKTSTTLLGRYYHPWLLEDFKDGKSPENYDPTLIEKVYNYEGLDKYKYSELYRHYSNRINFTVNNEMFAPNQVRKMAITAKEVRRLIHENNGEPYKIILKGHASEEGKEVNNMALSRRRADNVKHYLVAAGIPANLVEVEAYGESKPLLNLNQDTEEGRAMNRRVEISIQKLDTTKKGEDKITDKCFGWNLDDFNMVLVKPENRDLQVLRFFLKKEKYGIPAGTFVGGMGPVTIAGMELKKVGLFERYIVNHSVPLTIEKLKELKKSDGSWKFFPPVTQKKRYERGDAPFREESFMQFWSHVLNSSKTFHTYYGNDQTHDVNFSPIRDAIRLSGVENDYPQWTDLENCKNFEEYDEKDEEKAKRWIKTGMNMDPVGTIGGGILGIQSNKKMREKFLKSVHDNIEDRR